MTEQATSMRAARTPDPRRWGVSYRGVGSVQDTAAATARALGAQGVACAVSRLADGTVAIEGETRKPWYRLLLGANPQRVRGWIEGSRAAPGTPEEQGEVRLSLDFFFQAWYRRLIVCLWSLWVVGLSALFQYTDPEQFRGGERAPTVLLLGVFGLLAVVMWVPFLLRSVGGARFQALIWQPILWSVDRAGGYLEPEGSGAGRRFGLWFISYGASFVLFSGGAFVLDALEGTWQTSPSWFWFMVFLLALAILFLGSAFSLGVWRGFGLRVEAIVLGLGSSVVALVLLAAPVLPAMTERIAEKILDTGSPDAGWWARVIVCCAVMTVLFGLGLGLYLLSLSRYVWRPLERTYGLRGRAGIYHDAVEGGPLLVAARGFFGAYGVAIVAVVVASLALTAAWGAQALGVADFEAPPLRAPAGSGPVLAAALGLPPDNLWAGVAARAGWLAWGAAVWALVGLSVGELARQRRRLRRSLEDRAPGDSRPHRLLVECADRLTSKTGSPRVRLAVSSDEAIGAFSHRFSWPRRTWFVEISEGALEHLAPDELEALLAHELVHLRRAHVLVHDLMRWFGRLAFLGDAFCEGLLDSFGWEVTADLEAARALGDRKQALIRCLWKIAAVNPGKLELGGTTGLAMDAPSESSAPRGSGDRGSSGWPSLAVAWRRFIEQYTGQSDLHYWHPVTDERVERIRKLGMEADGNEGDRMSEADLRQAVRRVARQHLEATHPERLEELDAVFDVAFAKAVERAPRVDETSRRHGLAFDASMLDPSLVAFTVTVALQFLQIAKLSRKVEHLKELVEGAKGFTKVQKSELRQIAELVAREVATWVPENPAEPLPVEALQLIVLRRERHGRPVLEFLLHGRLQGNGEARSYDHQSFGECVLQRNPAEHVWELSERMVMRDPKNAREEDSFAKLAQQRGAFLFESLLSKPLQKELRALAPFGGPLLVISEEPWIPWELLRVPTSAEGGDASFLSEAFALARWLPGSTPASTLPLGRIALVRSDKAEAERSGQETSALVRLIERAGRNAEMVPAESTELMKTMAQGVHDAWHFIGHGDRTQVGAEWDELALDDGVLTPQHLSGEVAVGLAKMRPFVFLNACRVGSVAEGLTGIGGWPARFLEAGAGAFLAPLWAVPGDRAAAFAPPVYERLLAGEPIGEAVRQARLMLRHRSPGDPTWLAYALYADPGAVSSPTGF